MIKKILAYLIHLFTASGAVLGVFSIWAINNQRWSLYFIFIMATIIVDAVDGTFARMIDIKKVLPNFDGAMLDNIIDYFNYGLIPSYFILVSRLLDHPYNIIACILIIVACSYQFTQKDAKTADHFFKRFPSYWNILVFYLYYWQTHFTFNFSVIVICFILSFVPIKFIYPSRVDYLSKNPLLRKLMVLATIGWGILTCALIATYPERYIWLDALSVGYILAYFLISLYRTFVPLELSKS